MENKTSVYYILEKFRAIADRVPRFYKARYFKIVMVAYAVIMLPLTYMAVRNQMIASRVVEEEEEVLPMVKLMRVSEDDFSDNLSVIGTVKGAAEVSLKFEISGRIRSINFREGQNVSEGAVIASLDPEDVVTRLEHARAKLASVQSQYQAAREQYNVYQDLYRMGAIIRAKLREMEQRIRSHEAEVQRARSELRMAESELSKTVITAPSEGIMGTRFADPGDFVTPHDEIGTFLEVENVYVEAGIIEREIERIREGQEVDITFDAYPDQVFSGIVDNVARMVRGETRTLPIQIKIENPDLKLFSGMLASCEIVLDHIEDAIMVPTDSIIDLGDMEVIPVVRMDSDETGEVELRKIQTGYMRSDLTQILDGLRSGDLIVNETQAPLRDRMRVRVIEVSENKVN